MRTVLAALLLASPALSAHAADFIVYDDALRNDFQNYSYGDGATHDFDEAGTVHTGATSIRFVGADFGAVSFFREQTLAIADFPTLRLWVHGGTVGGQTLTLFLQNTVPEPDVFRSVSLNAFIPGGAPQAGVWRQVDVPLDAAPLADIGSFNRIDIQIDAAAVQPAVFFDDVVLLDGGPAPADPIFDDGFEGDDVAPPDGIAPMLIERDVLVDGILSDRFTWRDAALEPRVAVLAHNNQPSFNGSRGGALREFRYQVGGATRVARTTQYDNGGYRGFGYVVSHRREGSTGIGVNDSPLGASIAGQFDRVFEGRHHAIFRFTQNYPRHSRTGAAPPNTLYQVPVTIEWLFSTGRDHPLWSITWDLEGGVGPGNLPLAAGQLDDDARAPYGELLFDGSDQPGFGHSTIAGVAWGDRYRFTSTTTPVTLNSDWTWNTPNTIPFVKLWTTAVDATMGLVQTETLDQQDAGGGRIDPGYVDVREFWGKTSADGDAGPGYTMPQNNEWPYQAIAFSFGGNDATTNNTRLTWGTQYGFLGQQPYYANNIIGLDNTASGWPKKNYSVHVVLGTHSSGPVESLIAQNEAIQSLTLTAAVGSVAVNGPAGVADASVVVYAPAGYDAVRGALAFVAAGNALDANIAVGAGTLRQPLIVLRNWTAGADPDSVRLGNAELVADVDYFLSRRAATQELWITLDRELAGAQNRLRIDP